jgi:hypothetical protein
MTNERKAPVPPAPSPITPATARAWVHALAGDPRARGQALGDYVARGNRTAMPVTERLEFLDAVRGAALHALIDLDTLLGSAAHPLNIDDRAALFTSRKLATEMATAYQLAIAQWPATATKGRPPIAPALLQAMQFAADVLLASFRSYTRVPDGAWKRLHAIYALAETHGVATGIADAATRRSIAEAYAEVLLLAVTDPYRFAPGETDRVLAMLRRLRAPASLTREPPASRPSGHFIVAGDLDQPPRSALLADEDTGGTNWRFLDANAAVDRLREALEALEAGQSPPALASWSPDAAREAARRLMRLWEDPPHRVFRRDAASGSVAICVGVKPIAHFVAHDASGEEDHAALRDRLTMPLRALPEDEAGRLIPIHEWNVVNLSAGGMKVRRTASTSHPIAVGEIVGIKTPGKPLWTIGATRWITAQDDGTTEFGVQFFAEAACAVWMKRPSPALPPTLAILVTFAEEDRAGEALLAPPESYAQGLEFEVRGEGLRYRAQAGEAIERNAYFDLFRIDVT